MRYYQTPLEEWVTKFYKNLRITDPDDLTEENLCFMLRIYLYRRPVPSSSYESGNFRSITLDSRLSPAEQREQFFHELCHILRHYGRQTGRNRMPEMFWELQEWDAKRFTLYASMPYHMLRLFDLTAPDIAQQLSRRFVIPIQLCHKRLEQIKQRILLMKKDIV